MVFWHDKLDPYSRLALEDAAADEERTFDVAVRLSDDDPGALDALANAGLETYSAVGAIVAGRIRGQRALERITRLTCVAEVQLSRPMYDEKPDGEK
jgi:hypothetical protein